jgi:hypothetical protein
MSKIIDGIILAWLSFCLIYDVYCDRQLLDVIIYATDFAYEIL